MEERAKPLRVGSLANAAGVGTETIRYYQRRKLLGQPLRPQGGQRVYPPEYVERVQFIKRAQMLGFSLDEIATLLRLDRGSDHARAHAVAQQRLAQIEEKLADLAAMRDALADLVRRCERTRGKVACPIIVTLASARSTAQPPKLRRRPPERPGPTQRLAHRA